MHVADIGSGSGFYVLAAARAVGESGRVYAIDIQKELPARVKNLAEKEGFFNVEALWADVEVLGGTRLGDASVHAVIASNIFFQIEDKKNLIAEIKRILKLGGRALVIDWTDSFGGLGPEKEAVVNKETIEKLFADAGFSKEKEIKAGEHHFGVVFTKKDLKANVLSKQQ